MGARCGYQRQERVAPSSHIQRKTSSEHEEENMVWWSGLNIHGTLWFLDVPSFFQEERCCCGMFGTINSMFEYSLVHVFKLAYASG